MREKLDAYVDRAIRARMLRRIALEGEPVVTTSRIETCRDPKDDKFLELCVDGRADALVTGDADLLVLSPFQGIKVVGPSAFLERP